MGAEITLQDVYSGLLDLGQAMQFGFQRIEERFQGIDERMAAFEYRLNARLDQRIEESEARTNARFEEFEGRMNKRFDRLELRVGNLEHSRA